MANKYATYGSDPTQAAAGIANGLRETTGDTNLTMAGVTDGEYLKRSGSTIISGASTLAWTSAYSVDFTSLGSQNLKTGGNGTKTIDGKVWTWENDANATSSNVTNGTGIVIVCNTNNSNYGGSTRTTPILTLPFQTLISGYSVQRHIVRVRTRVLLTNCDANTEGARLIIEDSSAPTNQNVNYFKGFSGGVSNQVITVSGVTAVSTTRSTSTSTDDVLGLVWEGPKSVEFWSGTYGGSLTLSTLRWSECQDMANPLMFKPTQPRIGLVAGTANVAGSFTATFTHMEVDYFSKNPAP